MLKIESLDDLQRLIIEALPESLTLEYKASPALNRSSEGRSELIKDVTALANSAGGQIIYGIIERNGLPQSIDCGVASDQISAEWISQVLDTNSAPRVQGLSIAKIVLDSANPNLVAYVITVPPATAFAPHQNSIDKKYYRRFELRSVPLHDYEIRDLLRRGQTPELTGRMTFADGSLTIPHHTPDRAIEIIAVMENLSGEPSLYSLFDFGFDYRLKIINDGGFKRMRDSSIADYKIRVLQKSFIVPNEFPLLRGSNITIGPPYISLMVPQEYFGGAESFLLTCSTLATGSKTF